MTSDNVENKTSFHTDQDHLSLERLIFFSDAVFAIAITLLALEIRLPASEGNLTNSGLTHALLNLWPKYLGYLVSFLVIGVFWNGHHRKFLLIKRVDNTLISLNFLLLMAIAFIPFPTSVLSEYGNRTATIFYALVMVLIGLLSFILWQYASYHDRLVNQGLNMHQLRKETLSPLIMSGIFLLSIGIAFINDDLAKFLWILTSSIMFINK